MSSKLPDEDLLPEHPSLHLKDGFLCVAAPLSLTEACFAVPAVRALHHFRPESKIAVICPDFQEALWQGVSELDYVITYPERATSRQIARILSEYEVSFVSAICWGGGEVAKAFQRVDIPQRLGYPTKELGKHLTGSIDVFTEIGPIEHRVRYYLNLVQFLGGEPFVRSSFATKPLLLPSKKPRIVLAPESEYGASHEWPLENFVDLVERYEISEGEVDWIILSSKINPEPSGLKQLLGDRVEDYTTEWDMGETLSGLRSCSGLVASDCELAHLAGYVGLPAVVVFGPNEPEWKRPLGKQSRVVREHVACSPCYMAKCTVDMRCQGEVTVAMVLEQLKLAVVERNEG